MEDGIQMTITVERELWEHLKQLSGDLKDAALFLFIFQVGQFILESIKRKSLMIEINGETQQESAVDFADLLDQYGFDDLDDFIQDATPDDFL